MSKESERHTEKLEKRMQEYQPRVPKSSENTMFIQLENVPRKKRHCTAVVLSLFTGVRHQPINRGYTAATQRRFSHGAEDTRKCNI